MTNRTSFSFKLTPLQEKALTDILKSGNYRPASVEHTTIAADTDNCRICLYKSGKCLVQGKGTEEFVTFVLEPSVLGKAVLGYEDFHNPEGIEPHMGVDESGKGDFFGPLVIAAACINASFVKTLREMDVKDSKNIKSDKKALAMGSALRRLLGHRFTVVKIGPEAYNKLYAKFRSVNSMLAWGHARAIENLLEQVPDCPKAISDQFGKKEQVERALMQKGRKIELVQRHRAEADLAVAAASIIAREEFLRALKKMETDYKMRIPKGASEEVRKSAVEIARAKGAEELLKTVKCHFKTTDQVLGELGTDRKALGPIGQVVSKVSSEYYRARFRAKKQQPTQDQE